MFDFFPGLFLIVLGVPLGIIVIVVMIVAGVLGESKMADERRGRWLPLVYYYLATVIGLTLMLFGIIRAANGLVTTAIPQASDEYVYSEYSSAPTDDDGNPIKESPKEKADRESQALEQARLAGIAGAVRGVVMALVAAPVFFWHLRQARRKESDWVSRPPTQPIAS